MKILQVLVGYHPARGEFGGIVETVEHLSNTLVSRGHEVEVWTSALVGRGRPLCHGDVTARREGVTLRYFRAYHPRQLGYGFAISPSFARTIRAEAAGFDIVHINDFRSHFMISSALACLERDVPYVLQTHGTLPPVVHRVALKRVFDRVLGDHVIKNAGGLVAISHAEAEIFADHGVAPDDVEVVYNGIDFRMLDLDLGDGDFFKSHMGVEAEDVLLYLGRVHERKGIQHAVAALAKLRAEGRDVHLVIVGPDDGYEAELRGIVADSGVAEHISMPGCIYGVEKYRAYRSASLVVYPAIHEFFGLVPFEGLLCGTPAVVCEGDGCAEVLDDVKGGWTVPWAKPEALARTVAEALDEKKQQPEHWQSRIDKAREHILDRYSWDAATDKLLAIYDRAMAR